MSGREQILKTVNEKKASNARETLKELEEREWNRETFHRNYEKAMNEIKSIDNNLSEIDERIDRLLGRGDGLSSKFDRVREEVGEEIIDQLESTHLGNGHTAGVKTFEELREELNNLYKKREEWKAFQLELALLALRKIFQVTSTFKEEFKSSEVAEDVLEFTQDRMEDKFDKLESELRREIERRTSRLESAVEAARTEAKFYRDYFERFGEVTVDALEEVTDQAEALPEQASEDSDLEDLADEDDRVDLSKPEQDDGSASDEEVMDKVNQIPAGSSSEAEYEIKGKELDDQKSILFDLVQDNDIEEMSKTEVADLTDVSRQALFKSGGIVDRVEKEYSTAFGLEEM